MKFVGVVGRSGSGKTTLIVQLLPLLHRMKLRVSTLKHAHHGFDLDRPGKDSFRHRQAGAEEVMLVSNGRWALLHEQGAGGEAETSLRALARRMTQVDILLIEGFQLEEIPRIEVYRPSLGKSAIFSSEPGIVAVASDTAITTGACTLLPLNRPDVVAEFIASMPKTW